MRLKKFPERSKVIQGARIRPDGIDFRSAHCTVTAPQGSGKKHALGVGRQEAATPSSGSWPADSSGSPGPAEVQVKCSGHFSASQELSV